MSDIAIRVENLGKQYKIGRLQKRSGALRDALANRVSRIANRKSNAPNGDMPSAIRDTPSAVPTQSSVLAPQSSEYIWALRDVSFECLPRTCEDETRRGRLRSHCITSCSLHRDRSEDMRVDKRIDTPVKRYSSDML